jgi:hypothetical protein
MLLGVLPAVVVVLAIVGVNATRAWNGIVVRIESELVSEASAAVREIDARNARNIGFVRMMALAQESGQFGRRAETLRMLERVLRTNPDVYAAYLAYEPNADGQDAAGAQPGVPANALGAGGRFYPYFKRDPSSPAGFVLEPLQSSHGEHPVFRKVAALALAHEDAAERAVEMLSAVADGLLDVDARAAIYEQLFDNAPKSALGEQAAKLYEAWLVCLDEADPTALKVAARAAT